MPMLRDSPPFGPVGPSDSAMVPRMPRGTRLLFGIGLIVAGSVAVAMAEVRSEIWCDPVTGSLRHRTVWPLGLTAGWRHETSPLETRLREIGCDTPPDWRKLSTRRRKLFELEFACGTAPPIYEIRTLLQGFVLTSSPDELCRFAEVLRTGSDQEQEAAVRDAGEKALAALRTDGARGAPMP